MRTILSDVRDILVSLKLTVVLIALSIILILVATLDQVHLGIWAVQEKYFRTFIVFWDFNGVAVPIFPGGYFVGGLLLLNLIAAHIFRFKATWRKSGILLVHFGIILLLVGELLTGLLQDEFFLRLDQGQTKNYSESHRDNELAIIDLTDPGHDEVVSIPQSMLAQGKPVQHPKLPFRVIPKSYFPNSSLRSRVDAAAEASQGVGTDLVATRLPITYKTNENNMPSALVELVGTDGSIGTWLVSALLAGPQRFEHGGRVWTIALRARRHYTPFSLTLLKFSHDRYAGTEIPKNFSSRVRLTTPNGSDDREVLIYMNNPLRYAGLTFYQAGFDNNDRTTVLQVVRNPSWLLPYAACTAMTIGLLFQFGLHLAGSFGRRSTARRAAPAKPVQHSRIPIVAAAASLALVVGTFVPPKNKTAFDLRSFGHVPVLVNGRIKPVDTVARTSLLVLQGRQRVANSEGRALTPAEWLLDVSFRPELADRYQTFEIVHPDVLSLLNLETGAGAGGKRFSFQQLAPGLRELDRQARLADAVEAPVRTPFQKAIVQLRNNLILYQRLQSSLVAPEVDTFLGAWEKLRVARTTDRTAQPSPELSLLLSLMERGPYLLAVPPPAGSPQPDAWISTAAWLRAAIANQGELPFFFFGNLAKAWREQNHGEFNRLIQAHHSSLADRYGAHVTKNRVETVFNAAQPFYTSTLIYVAAFLLAVLSWLKWPETLSRSAFALVALAFALTTAGIVTRMWLEDRPPVTNLYSSALFVGWGAVGLCLVIERIYRNAVASVAAGLIGFSTLLIAHHLSLGGDTLEMMRAVLDSNFWLATHVVVITLGYAATFLAGFLALIYVLRGVFTRSLDRPTADSLNRMVYGIVCFATLFSLVGTVLGGIWADQSWGRFWGWDPKENGALIIVLWNALILHARWGGMIKDRGLMSLAIFGNIVTAWSWFGVNMLGVGLHSYGFMDAAFWWLVAFFTSQLALIGLAAIPAGKWRSHIPLGEKETNRRLESTVSV